MPDDGADDNEEEAADPASQTPGSARKEMLLSSQLYFDGKKQTVHALNVIPEDTVLIKEGDKRIIVLPGRLRDAFMAPPSVMNLIRAIEKKPSDFGARNIAMICDALLPFVHNEGPNASERYHVEFTEPRGKLEYMFKFEYSLSTTAKEVINSLGIELNSFRLRQEVSLGIPEMKQFEADNEFYGGFTGRIGKANAFFYVPNGLELAVDNKIFSKGWYIDSKISLKHMTNGFYVFKYNDHLYLAHELFEEDIGKYNPINEIHHSYTEIIYLTGEGPYPYRVELAVDSDNVRIKNTSHDPLLVHLRKGESFTMDQIKKKINKEGLRG